VLGLRVKPQHLSESVRLGSAWDLFIRAQHEEGFDYLPGVQALQLTPEQASILSSLTKAYKILEIAHNPDELIRCQHKFNVPIEQTNITGFIDRLYPKHFVETKLSSRPEFYQQRENLIFQLSTYFMSDESLESCRVEITRVPQLKTGWGKFTDEDPEKYSARILSDVLSRPSFYFIGWDRQAKTFGVRFWRSEFDLDSVYQTYVWVLEEIQETARRGSWYENHLGCHVPGPCPYLPIKRTGVVSEEIYERKEVKRNESAE